MRRGGGYLLEESMKLIREEWVRKILREPLRVCPTYGILCKYFIILENGEEWCIPKHRKLEFYPLEECVFNKKKKLRK